MAKTLTLWRNTKTGRLQSSKPTKDGEYYKKIILTNLRLLENSADKGFVIKCDKWTHLQD